MGTPRAAGKSYDRDDLDFRRFPRPFGFQAIPNDRVRVSPMSRRERFLWFLGLVGAFAAGIAICRRDRENAPEPSRVIMSIGPEDWSVWNERGRARAHRSDFRGALADFDKALELNPESPMVRNNRGGALMSLGDLQGALAEFNAALKINPMYAEAHLNRGQAKADLGDPNGAIDDLESALALTDKSWAFRGFTVHKLELLKQQRRSRTY